MAVSRLYKIAHSNQSVSSGAPARRREPPIRGEKSIMTGPWKRQPDQNCSHR